MTLSLGGTRYAIRARILLTAWRLGLYVPPDRRVLERVILPYYGAAPGCRRVLFVGVRPGIRSYQRFFPTAEFVTLDANPYKRAFGSKRHVVGRVEHLADYFSHDYFDVIVMNGVIGWGLNDERDVNEALRMCSKCLTPGGLLILGLNEQIPSTPPLGHMAALAAFDPVECPPIAAQHYNVPTPLPEREHSFAFYQKPTSAPSTQCGDVHHEP